MNKKIGLLAATLAAGFTFVSHALPGGEVRLKKGAVVYGVVPPLFGDEPFKDVTGRLDELQDLGVDVLWLSPVKKTDDMGAISYSITDYFNLREDFGSEEDLRELVREAQRRGMKVVMDFVPNHTSKEHPYFTDTEKLGEKSAYYDYYERDDEGNPKHYFDWEHLPNLNFSKTDVVTMITKAFRYWVRKFGIDGYRVDVAWGIRERAPAFWSKLNAQLRKDRRDAVMIAEGPSRDPYYLQSGFDLAYDWSGELGVWDWAEAFRRPSQAGRILADRLAAHPQPQGVLRFLNNNDTGLRFITKHGEALTRTAIVLQHAVPGVPLLFSGDDVGAEYEPYEDPPPLDWNDRKNLRALYRRLADLRESREALHSGGMTVYPVNQPGVLVFKRQVSGGRGILAVLNFGAATTVKLDLKSIMQSESMRFTDLLREAPVSFRGKPSLAALKLSRRQALLLE